MNDTYIREMVRKIITTTSVSVTQEGFLHDALTSYWQDYAVGTIGLEIIEEIAQGEHPMSLAEAREILYQLEENGDITYDGALAAVDDWAASFNWEDPEEPIPYAEFSMKTCNWQIIADVGFQQIGIDTIPYTQALGCVIRSAAQFAASRSDLDVKRWLVVVSETEKTVFDSSKNWHAGFGTPRFDEDQEVSHER